ncbi:MAG: hydroxymethylglutaryl-CoA lyase [Bacteroidia bacterium]|jgi:hydroxymethylglutaryl-CoA lyase
MMTAERLTLVECPRDAMQGIKNFIPTSLKIKYLTTLLQQGFDILDCGSFVNPESIPQMADTAEVVQAISQIETNTKLLVIVANERGALRAVAYPKIKYLGFPLSVSETFQKRNTNASREEAFRRLARIQDIAVASGKEVVCYLSMAFGNPYGDEWSAIEVAEWASKIASLGIRTISLSDTIGNANSHQLGELFSTIHHKLPHVQIGVHLHAKPDEWLDKVEAAFQHGCRRFDAALGGFGGCPMAKDDLVGNIPSEGAFQWLSLQGKTQLQSKLDWAQLKQQAIEVYAGIIG